MLEAKKELLELKTNWAKLSSEILRLQEARGNVLKNAKALKNKEKLTNSINKSKQVSIKTSYETTLVKMLASQQESINEALIEIELC